MKFLHACFPPIATSASALRPWLAVCLTVILSLGLAFAASPARAGTWTFTEVSVASGFNYTHGFTTGLTPEVRMLAGGVAAGDYDDDGWADLYVIRGDIGSNLLFRNRGDGTFEEVGGAAGVALAGVKGNGPTFADFDGDGQLDLTLGGVDGAAAPRLLRNQGDGTFTEVTASSGISLSFNVFSSTYGDYDRDGDLDLVLSFWNNGPLTSGEKLLWRNDGTGQFTDVTVAALGASVGLSNSFTPNFSDINSDGHPDLLMAADFGTSWYALNDGDGTFTEATTAVISDENGMGASVGDYDNDGDLDWFVTSIWDPDGVVEGNWGITGNRLYRNDGSGTFEDVTAAAGVREGYWGWASCFADFDNDGVLDIYHVNGFPVFDLAGIGEEFQEDPARMFVGDGDGTFTERSVELGLADTGQGRGIVCFDHDHDGDIDIFIANNNQAPSFYRNDGGNALNFLALTLRANGGNRHAVGARVHLTVGGVTQMRELSAGSNYLSQNPPGEVHFGIGAATTVDEVRVDWPDGGNTTLTAVAANQFLEVNQAASAPLFEDGFEAGNTSAWTLTLEP